VTARRTIWTVTVAASVLVAGGAYLALPHSTAGPAPARVFYGVPVKFAGGDGACVTAVLHPVTHRWVCTQIEQSVLRTGVPVVSPGPFPSGCTYVDADQHRARWLCRMTSPADGSSLPGGLPIVG
jgi:hypothetical protein